MGESPKFSRCSPPIAASAAAVARALRSRPASDRAVAPKESTALPSHSRSCAWEWLPPPGPPGHDAA
eukprot:15454528-Alexandrium_andersonii.AAC.1